MSRYRPQRARARKLPVAVLERTANYQALDRPPVRGVRTPIEWPPQARR